MSPVTAHYHICHHSTRPVENVMTFRLVKVPQFLCQRCVSAAATAAVLRRCVCLSHPALDGTSCSLHHPLATLPLALVDASGAAEMRLQPVLLIRCCPLTWQDTRCPVGKTLTATDPTAGGKMDHSQPGVCRCFCCWDRFQLIRVVSRPLASSSNTQSMKHLVSCFSFCTTGMLLP